jgi:hypothetical protein
VYLLVLWQLILLSLTKLISLCWWNTKNDLSLTIQLMLTCFALWPPDLASLEGYFELAER